MGFTASEDKKGKMWAYCIILQDVSFVSVGKKEDNLKALSPKYLKVLLTRELRAINFIISVLLICWYASAALHFNNHLWKLPLWIIKSSPHQGNWTHNLWLRFYRAIQTFYVWTFLRERTAFEGCYHEELYFPIYGYTTVNMTPSSSVTDVVLSYPVTRGMASCKDPCYSCWGPQTLLAPQSIPSLHSPTLKWLEVTSGFLEEKNPPPNMEGMGGKHAKFAPFPPWVCGERIKTNVCNLGGDGGSAVPPWKPCFAHLHCNIEDTYVIRNSAFWIRLIFSLLHQGGVYHLISSFFALSYIPIEILQTLRTLFWKLNPQNSPANIAMAMVCTYSHVDAAYGILRIIVKHNFAKFWVVFFAGMGNRVDAG